MATTLAAGDDPAIIAAEDHPAIRAVLEETLGAVEGWSVTTVADGAELLEALATLCPSLILLDVNMPGLDGLEVYRLLRGRDGMADVPVLFVTARPDALNKANLVGPYDQLAKPFDIDALEAKVSAMLGEARPRCFSPGSASCLAKPWASARLRTLTDVAWIYRMHHLGFVGVDREQAVAP